MSINPMQVIQAARDYHPAFDQLSTPNVVALRRIARYQQAVLSEIAQFKLDALHIVQSIPLPLVTAPPPVIGQPWGAGVPLQPNIKVHGGNVFYIDTTRPATDLSLLEYPLRFSEIWDDNDCKATINAGVLFLLGITDDWQMVSRIDIDLFPSGPDSLAINVDLVLPGSPLRACAADLAALMAQRAGLQPPSDVAMLHESYLDEVTQRRQAVVGTIADVF